ncbi:MAG TPA: FAD-binding protein [Thermoanaerobaculia bacterium]|jgi:FAD/FMN-containing dehydrogenase
MNRRNFLRRAAALPFFPALSPILARLAPQSAKKRFRRVRPTDPDWPSPERWAHLREQVGGRLVPVTSPLAPCKDAPGDAACAARLEELKNPWFLADDPGATQISGFQDAWTSAPSVYAIVAQKTEDVVAAVNFARDHRLRLVVKGGGHSYLGTSNAPDSLLVWTRDLRGIAVHDAFVPLGCAGNATPRKAVSLGAGVRWVQAYDAVTTRAGRYVQGGGCCTVGVVGLVSGGGFGSFSKRYGMAAASLLEAEVVTADGKVRIANACTHPDLFWALKGGGTGSLGVVTRITLATHELPEFFGSVSGKIQAKSDGAYRKLVGEFLRFYEKALFNPHWGEQALFEPDNTLKIHMLFASLTDDEAEATWKPFRQFLADSPGDFLVAEGIDVGTMAARRWWDYDWRAQHTPRAMKFDPRPGAPPGNVWWSDNSGEANAFVHGYESLWMPAPLFRDPDRLADAVYESSRHFEVQFHFNKGLAGAPPEAIAAARDTAVNPAVLDAFTLAIIATGVPHANPGVPGHAPDEAKARSDAAAIAAAMEKLRAVVPEAASYSNESNYFERGFQKSYWGTNHPRLAGIKKKYDPDGFFFVHNGVGSEEWSRDGFERVG